MIKLFLTKYDKCPFQKLPAPLHPIFSAARDDRIVGKQEFLKYFLKIYLLRFCKKSLQGQQWCQDDMWFNYLVCYFQIETAINLDCIPLNLSNLYKIQLQVFEYLLSIYTFAHNIPWFRELYSDALDPASYKRHSAL